MVTKIVNSFGQKVFIQQYQDLSMAVNLNRGKLKKYSSSNRIGSLIGNGLLTFIDYKKKFNHFSILMKLYFIMINLIFQRLIFIKRTII